MDIGFVVHVHVFNVHRGSIASRDHLKAGHDISQSSLLSSISEVSEIYLQLVHLAVFSIKENGVPKVILY